MEKIKEYLKIVKFSITNLSLQVNVITKEDYVKYLNLASKHIDLINKEIKKMENPNAKEVEEVKNEE